MRLECVASWTLMSPVQSMAKVRLAHSRRDALLLAFMDAKERRTTDRRETASNSALSDITGSGLLCQSRYRLGEFLLITFIR